MTTEQRLGNALRELIYVITCLCQEEDDGSHKPVITAEQLSKARAALAELDASPAQSAEPVAWIVRNEDDPDWDTIHLARASAVNDSMEGDEIIPLYTHPNPLPEPADNTPKHGQRMRWTNSNGDVYEGTIEIEKMVILKADTGTHYKIYQREYNQLEPLAQTEKTQC